MSMSGASRSAHACAGTHLGITRLRHAVPVRRASPPSARPSPLARTRPRRRVSLPRASVAPHPFAVRARWAGTALVNANAAGAAVPTCVVVEGASRAISSPRNPGYARGCSTAGMRVWWAMCDGETTAHLALAAGESPYIRTQGARTAPAPAVKSNQPRMRPRKKGRSICRGAYPHLPCNAISAVQYAHLSALDVSADKQTIVTLEENTDDARGPVAGCLSQLPFCHPQLIANAPGLRAPTTPRNVSRRRPAPVRILVPAVDGESPRPARPPHPTPWQFARDRRAVHVGGADSAAARARRACVRSSRSVRCCYGLSCCCWRDRRAMH